MPPLLGLSMCARLGTTAAALLLLGGSGAAQPAPGAPPPPRSGTVVFGGDVIPHGSVLDEFDRRGGAALFAPLAPLLGAADLALANLETPAAASRPVMRHGMRFNVGPAFVRALAEAGFDGVTVANNHSLDQGARAVGETVVTVRAAGLRVMGAAAAGEDPLAPAEYPLAGGTLCVYAATRIHNYGWLAPPSRDRTVARLASAMPFNDAQEGALLAAVRAGRARCGAVLVTLHSGQEYAAQPLPRDRAYFRRLADAGADAVIGHHSHTVQPVELFTTRDGRAVPIFYSLGNLLSGQGYLADGGQAPPRRTRDDQVAYDPRLREGLLAVLRFEAAASPGTRLRLAEFGYAPLWTIHTRRHPASGATAAVAAALMPRDNPTDPLLAARWRAVLAQAGERYVLAPAALPAGDATVRTSDAAVRASRAPFVPR